MPDVQPTREPRSLDSIERDVLYLLTGEVGSQSIWSLDDLGRGVESDDDAQVAVEGLQRDGLAHRTSDGHVFASRAGVRAIEFTGHVV